MSPKNFLSGLEEIFARLAGLLLTILFFIVYVAARDEISLDWTRLISFLAIFWIIYEIVSYLLFVMFRFFSRDNQTTKTTSTSPNENSTGVISQDYSSVDGDEGNDSV